MTLLLSRQGARVPNQMFKEFVMILLASTRVFWIKLAICLLLSIFNVLLADVIKNF